MQFRFAVTFTILVAILLALMNTYPTRASRDIVFTEKQSALTNRAAVVSSSLSLLDNLTPDNTRQVLALLDLRDLTRIIVTDSEGLAVYDSASENNIRGKYVLYPELVRALDGQAVFYSHYTTGAFLSRAAMPVMNSGRTVGAVYVCESDGERAALIGSIQRRLATITIGIGAAALVVLWFSIKMLTRRITQLADGVRTVQRGDYSFRLTLSGHDELTELGQEFNNLTERLETTEAQRRRFVSDASHELKTPLASIRLLSDSISQSADMDSTTMREFVADIGSEAERLQRTTEKLLDLSRRDDGVQPDVTIVDLQQAVHGTLHLLRPLADRSSVTITCLMSEGVTVRASEDDIYHIVFNLVENAIKYNLPGGDVTVRVETRGEQSILSVADTGIGIPEADRPNIFNRFYRVDKARSREHGGSGLGLSIVHDAAALYGGVVTVDGVEPHGTRFTVTFPRAAASGAPETPKGGAGDMKRWLPLLLTLALALGCAGCARRQTVTVYRIAKEGAALLQTETITVPDGTDPVQVMIDALGAAPGDSTCFNPVRGWLTLGGYRIDDAGTLWLTVTSSDTASGIVRTQALACLVLSGTALDGVSAVGLEDTDGDALYAPLTANDLALTDPATDAQS